VYNKTMQDDLSHLTIEELAERVDIPIRTIRYYIAEGLLPGPEGRGKATVYNEEHLQRLRLIRLLAHQRRPLAEIHRLLNRLSLAEIRVLLSDEEQRTRELESQGQQPEPQEYIAALLRNAQASRQSPQVPAGMPPPAPPVRAVRESAHLYENRPALMGENWRRWELAPGVELHIKEEVAEQHRSLIERICKAAGLSIQPFHE
jgi:Ca-activated chloride channel family protein